MDENRIDQIKYEELRSKVRGLALERSIENPKKGNARATINGTWKLDITVNRDTDSSDLFIEKFYRDEDEDNEGNSDMVNAYSTVKVKKKMKFIMDTGCGYDLISQRKAQELGIPTSEGNDRMVFMTANGITETKEVANCTVDSFSEVAKPFVLEQTPAVFSVGMRCMKLGYSFVWPPGKQPFMINSSGKRIDLSDSVSDSRRRFRTCYPPRSTTSSTARMLSLTLLLLLGKRVEEMVRIPKMSKPKEMG